MDELIGLSTDDSFHSNNSSLSGDRNSLLARIAELEKKITDQGDEIVCLKSTLADVLRRLTQVEGRAIVTTSFHKSPPSQNGHLKNTFPRSNSFFKQFNKGSFQNGSFSHESQYSSPRRLSQYPSSTSLQSELANSNHVSPAPSPQPFNQSYRSNSLSNPKALTRMKRWSSQDIGVQSLEYSKTRSGSLANLHALGNASYKQRLPRGSKDFRHNKETGEIRFNILDRQVVINIPTDLLKDYTIQNNISTPSQRLKLEWVYGYRGKDCRHNLYLLPTGEIVYFIAAVVILYNADDQIQRHYTGHTSEIRCLTIHPNKLLIATGQNANTDSHFDKPHVRIWDSVSLNTLQVIGQNGEFDRGVCCLAFSRLDGGNLLCVVDNSNEHVVSLWDWHKGSNGHRLAESKSTCDTVLAVEFHPIEKYTLISIGRGHIFFWDIEGGTLAKKLGLFEKVDKPKFILCMAFNDMGELLTGDSNGNIIIWHQNSNRIVRTITDAHDGGIFDICTLKDNKIVTGGGTDKRIIEWDESMKKTGREAKYGGVRTLTTGKGSMIIVGTTKNCILQGTMSLNFSLVIQGHTEEVNALAIHPTQNQFVTAGYDKFIHLWDTMSHLVVWSKFIEESAQAATFSPDGNVLIVSTISTGRWIVFDATTRQLVSIHNDCGTRVDCLKFSSDGRYLALGTQDCSIYVYQVTDEYRKYNKIGRCSGHSSGVIDIDWDLANTYIQSTSASYEHLFWNASIGRQLNNMAIARDLQFTTHNSPIGFYVYGIWPEGGRPFVTSCDRANSSKIIVAADELGRLNLFSYPANQPKSFHCSYPGHCANVASVRFLSDDSRIISIGGRDSSIMQWCVT